MPPFLYISNETISYPSKPSSTSTSMLYIKPLLINALQVHAIGNINNKYGHNESRAY